MKSLLWVLSIAALVVGALFLFWRDPDTPLPSKKPQRIVCLAPVYTEIVCALGAADRLVGRTEWCRYPPGVLDLPVVGRMGQPDLEAVVVLRPDLILAPELGNKEDYEKLRGMGCRVETMEPGTFADALATIRRIGAWLGEDNEADRLVRKIEAERDQVLKRLEGRPRVRCAFVVGHDPLFVAGKGTFADDLLSYAGAENACGDAQGWARYGVEDFLARNPEVILDSTMGSERPPEELVVAFWKRWPDLAAVRGGRVHAVDPDLTNRPGPRIVGALVELASRIHPEAFPEAVEGRR